MAVQQPTLPAKKPQAIAANNSQTENPTSEASPKATFNFHAVSVKSKNENLKNQLAAMKHKLAESEKPVTSRRAEQILIDNPDLEKVVTRFEMRDKKEGYIPLAPESRKGLTQFICESTSEFLTATKTVRKLVDDKCKSWIRLVKDGTTSDEMNAFTQTYEFYDETNFDEDDEEAIPPKKEVTHNWDDKISATIVVVNPEDTKGPLNRERPDVPAISTMYDETSPNIQGSEWIKAEDAEDYLKAERFLKCFDNEMYAKAQTMKSRFIVLNFSFAIKIAKSSRNVCYGTNYRIATDRTFRDRPALVWRGFKKK